MAATILLPASFVAFCAERFFFAIADGLNPAGADARRREFVLNRAGALVAQSQVVVGGAALVAVSFNRNVDIGVLREERHVGLDGSPLVGANVGLVVVEIDVLNVLTKQVLVRNVRSWRRRRWRRLSYGKPCRGFLAPTRSLGDEVISRGIRRGHALRSVRLHGANSVNRHIGRIAGLPRQ